MIMNLFKRKNFNLPESFGSRGENSAVRYLESQGYKILETNFCNKIGRRIGEIDIIAKENEQIVFIEVKTRKISPLNSSLPEENINIKKLYKLNKTAMFYLRQKDLLTSSFRFDAISITANPLEKTAKLRHLKNIFL